MRFSWCLTLEGLQPMQHYFKILNCEAPPWFPHERGNIVKFEILRLPENCLSMVFLLTLLKQSWCIHAVRIWNFSLLLRTAINNTPQPDSDISYHLVLQLNNNNVCSFFENKTEWQYNCLTRTNLNNARRKSLLSWCVKQKWGNFTVVAGNLELLLSLF